MTSFIYICIHDTEKCYSRRMGKCELAESSFFVLFPIWDIPATCISKLLIKNSRTYSLLINF